MLSAVITLTYRNIVAVVDKIFLIWQILFPLVYIFVAGYAYSSLINENEISIGGKTISYNVFLAIGMIGFNVMNSSTVAGSIIWNDKRNGMLHQILVMPYSKLHYIASTLLTIIIMGLASATIILVAGLPIVAGNITIDNISIIYLIFALIMGSIFFGSFAIIVSTILKSNESFTVIINSVFLFFAFASSAFYPSQGLPETMQYAFYVNPLTYIADIIREGLFSAVDTATNIKVLVLTAISGVTFLIATRSMYKMRI
jgi:ABC-2 type transport system permease protein